VVAPERRKAVYLLSFLYFLVFVNNNAVNDVLIQRLLLLLITLMTTVLFGWIVYQVHPVARQQVKPWPKFLFRILPVAIFALLVALVANIIGSVLLAHLIVVGIIKSVIIGTILYVIARVIDGMVVLLIRKRTIQGLQFVDTYAHRMEQWAVSAVHLVAFFVWVRATLKAFRLYNPIYNWLQMILETRWQIGALTISVASIVNFILILTITFVVARLIRIFLDIEVFPRIRLPRGIPGAISMVVRYTIIGLGFFLALSAMGIDLGKFGLLAGALGVGLGFGLQNVIANFVSGLILVFERPIQVGDKIEVGNVLGLVKQIGVRSSTIRTFDGSEVIVPNADLISQQVTNWTLSDNRQRMKLPVKVAFDSDPEEVLELLVKIAREHPGVLNDPEPIATFNGFGDYFLDFTLYYWVSTNILQTKTEVALQVYRAIQTIGIEKPRPEQKLYLKNLEEPPGKRTSGNRKSGKGTRSATEKESES
jgi:small-conductance mechanosensitive channel